jgi:hypothetical protein
LASRIVSVRDQISKEWVDDLETLIDTNEELLVVYEEHQLEARASEDDDEDDDDDDIQDGKDLTSPYLDSSQDYSIYDRNAMSMSTNTIARQDRDSSPYRRSNFDLLVLLSTQESIHRVLREYMKEDDQIENFEWLREFYVEHVGKYFDGHQQSYGRADEFLEKLFTAPAVVQKGSKGEIHLIDPVGIVEDIIRERSEVAREWKIIAAQAPEDHIHLQGLILGRRMMELTDLTDYDIAASPLPENVDDLATAGTFE